MEFLALISPFYQWRIQNLNVFVVGLLCEAYEKCTKKILLREAENSWKNLSSNTTFFLKIIWFLSYKTGSVYAAAFSFFAPWCYSFCTWSFMNKFKSINFMIYFFKICSRIDLVCLSDGFSILFSKQISDEKEFRTFFFRQCSSFPSFSFL